ncbi:hypothetical protein ACFWM7_09085 [Streptomyces sp. NPDC058375]|uniref:hypothetical protein n=1 Tax=Streptomyces sp. NPDC058375 TaxID=3346467 RepID=UPI00365D19A7
MSRTQWWSLTALLAVVLGLLCGPAAFAAARAGAAVPGASASGGSAQAFEASAPSATARASASGASAQAFEASAPGASAPGISAPSASAAFSAAHDQASASVAEAPDAGTPVPGCGKLRDHDGEPAVPSRARTAHDHVPGLAPWGLPAATGALSAEPPPGIRAAAPAPYTPTPVELSVLRV